MTDSTLDPVVETLYSSPGKWLNPVADVYYMSVGGTGRVEILCPVGIQFSNFLTTTLPAHAEFYEDIKEERANNDEIGGAAVVSKKPDFDDVDNPVTWVEQNKNHVYIKEFVPFDERVTTREQLREELVDILEYDPDFSTIFQDAARAVKTQPRENA
ncbi:hypothetical protein [Haloarcula sp. Atlit-7R]|uniref:hypothetical protein n=1 Tax=Haloarcula sp. Atlit-7R TaxID=2282125 RepID=UPI000EF1709B|nr:hypothetical protein [Haloarcula sp. Atlit-7R]RLM94313.1 hypothetical protein D3D01_15735 [Haloarcula sp. Atlit-7R]